jgi:inorganic pyrophosphatase
MQQVKYIEHPWHISIGDNAPQIVKAVIEIPENTRVKYELDKSTGLLKMDRVLYASIYYPLNYGLVPQTYFDDGDPLDILVMCSLEIHPLCIVDAKVIGIMHMQDENGIDDKILSVAANDPAFHHINDITDVAAHQMNQLKHFFKGYKTLENKKVEVGNMFGRDKACECINHSMELYKQKFKQ